MQFIELAPTEAEKYVKTARDAMYQVVSKKAPVESEKILKMIIKKK